MERVGSLETGFGGVVVKPTQNGEREIGDILCIWHFQGFLLLGKGDKWVVTEGEGGSELEEVLLFVF